MQLSKCTYEAWTQARRIRVMDKKECAVQVVMIQPLQ